MRIYSDSTLPQLLKNKYIFIDTNVLIGAIKHPDLFAPFLKSIQDQAGVFVTVGAVLFEFVRGTNSMKDFNKRYDFLMDYCSLYPIEKHENDVKQFMQEVGSDGGKMSYTDFLLCTGLNKFSNGSCLISADLRDIPLKFFKRISTFTVDTDRDVIVYGVYSKRESSNDF